MVFLWHRYQEGTESDTTERGFVVFDKKFSRHHRVRLVFLLGKVFADSENRESGSFPRELILSSLIEKNESFCSDRKESTSATSI